jgi:hypothetical protein
VKRVGQLLWLALALLLVVRLLQWLLFPVLEIVVAALVLVLLITAVRGCGQTWR